MRLIVVAALLVLALTASGQRRATLYNEWFHEAQCSIESRTEADSTAYWLVLTLDEGNISVPRGSQLVMRLRGGIDITLTTDRDVTRADISLRRWRERTDRIITCYYPITVAQLTLLHEHDLRHLRIQTATGWIDRRIPRHLRLQAP